MPDARPWAARWWWAVSLVAGGVGIANLVVLVEVAHARLDVLLSTGALAAPLLIGGLVGLWTRSAPRASSAPSP